MDVKMESCAKLPHGKPRVSVVWKHFKMDTDDKNRVTCQICQEQLKYSGSTTSMKYHLKRHSSNPDISLDIAVPNCKLDVGRPSLDNVDHRKDSLTDSLVNMCVLDLIPTRVVEEPGFRQFVRCADPNYTIPSPQTLNRRITALYDACKCRLLSELRLCSDVTVSVERWTGPNSAEFVTVTAHYITPDWEFRSRVLHSEMLTDRPLSENIAEIVSCAARNCGISDASVVAAIHENDTEIPQSYALLDWHHFPCFAHTLSRCVAVAFDLPAVAELVTACREIVQYVLRCPTLVANVEARQKAEGALRCRFLQDSDNHWPSTFRMMDMVHEQRHLLFEVMRETLEFETLPKFLQRSEGNWARGAAVVEALRPLDTVREMLSGESHVTLSTVVPVLFSLVSVHLQVIAGDDEVVENLKQVVVREMKSQFSFDSNAFPESFGIMTTVLDPRHKSLPFLNNLQRAIVKTKLTALVEENRAMAPSGGGGPRCDEGRDDDSDDETATKRPKPTVAEFLSPIYEHGCGTNFVEESRTKNEVDSYLQEMPASLTSDPLTWWKLCGYKYPNLSRLARRMLCIPATAVPPARAFSGMLDPLHRSRKALDPDMVDRMVFLHGNLTAEELGSDKSGFRKGFCGFSRGPADALGMASRDSGSGDSSGNGPS